FTSWPGWLLIPIMLISSILAGAIWGGIVGILKAWRGAHEVVTTIMLNWIAFYVTDYLIDGPYQTKHGANQTNALPAQATLPHIADFYNSTLGSFLPKIANATQYLVDVGFFFALAALVLYWFIVSRTTFGYEIRVIGQNLKAAKYAGIPIKRNLFLVMAISGGFSGLAGGLQLMGQFPYTLIATDFAIQTTGFDAIGVALLGRMTSVGVLLGALLFGGLRQGGTIMQLNANIPGDLVYIIQALVLFSIASEFLPVFQRAIKRFSARSRKPALATPVMGETVEVTNLPTYQDADTGNGASYKGAEPSNIARTMDSEPDTASSDRTE
ncbi:MAG TPA: ABC transporter permease, partial [Ktedonobacteraceae bacterium]|nr:ABC transporter permease [Ktedonobacteraceae bacterium]